MRFRNYLWILVFTILAVISFVSWAFAQESLISTSLPEPSSKEKLHALSLTRFHFITLKQFHSSLFSSPATDTSISDEEARILNAALNAFLTSPERETLLLEALRQNKSIRLRFSLREEERGAYEIEEHPTKELLFQLKPVVRSVPAVIDIKPLLDRPVAFHVSLTKGNDTCLYEVDWSGKISRILNQKPSAMDRHLNSIRSAAKAVGTSA